MYMARRTKWAEIKAMMMATKKIMKLRRARMTRTWRKPMMALPLCVCVCARVYSRVFQHSTLNPSPPNIQLLIRLPSALNVAPSLSSTIVTVLFSGP